MKNRLKLIAGILLIFMGTLEFAAGFLVYPTAMVWSDTRMEWWASYFPIVLLLNSLVAGILCMYLGWRLTKEGSIFTESQDVLIWGQIDRWIERRKYGYNIRLYY